MLKLTEVETYVKALWRFIYLFDLFTESTDDCNSSSSECRCYESLSVFNIKKLCESVLVLCATAG